MLAQLLSSFQIQDMSYTAMFSNDGAHLAFTTVHENNNNVHLWSVKDARPLRNYQGHQDMLTCISFSRDGTKLLTVARDDTLKIWKLDQDQPVKTIKLKASKISSYPDIAAAFAPDGKSIAAAFPDGSLRIFGSPLGWQVRQMSDPSNLKMRYIQYSADGKYLASHALHHGYDDAIQLWDIQKGKKVGGAGCSISSPQSLPFSPDGRLFAMLDHLWARVWEVSSMIEDPFKKEYCLCSASYNLKHIAFSHSGQLLAFTAWEKPFIYLWKYEKGQTINILDESKLTKFEIPSPAATIAFGADDQSVRIACGESGQGCIQIWGLS